MKNIADLLERGRPRPMYNAELHNFGISLTSGHEANNDQIGNQFIDTFDQWLSASSLNQLSGLSDFQHRHVIQGVTQFIDDIYLRYSRHVFVMAKEYLYHQRLFGQANTVDDPNDIPMHAHLIIGMPFPFYGDVHPDMQEILDTCMRRHIAVHIDSAWIGCTRDICFDYNHPAISSIGFSLSKGLGLGYNRIGVRYARDQSDGSITIMNDFTMIPRVMCWYGLQFMQKFGSDYLQATYGTDYDFLCQTCELLPSKSIHLAHILNAGHLQPVGTREALRYLHANHTV